MMPSDSRLPVIVTGVGGGGHGHEIVKALRLAKRWKIIGVDMSPISLGLCDVDVAALVPPASSPEYVDEILSLAVKHGAKAVFHGSEPELKVLSAARDRFTTADLYLPLNSREVIALGMDKAATFSRLEALGVWVPRTREIAPGEAPPDWSMPVVVKPSVGGGGSANTYVVQTREELGFALSVVHAGGLRAVVQEYVGTPMDEFTVGVLHDHSGELVGSIAVRRAIFSGLSNRIKTPNRTGRSELGSVLAISSGVSQGSVEAAPELRAQAEAIAAALGSRGPLNLQCRFVDGRLCLFEINPRFSGTTYLRALVGFNEPDLVLGARLLNEPFPRPPAYRYATVVRGLREEIVPEGGFARADA
jgi:carbamoyl-phosphate synthase large subunit